MTDDVVVTARRSTPGGVGGGWSIFVERTELFEHPTLVPDGGGGGAPPEYVSIPLAIDCSNAQGLAKAVADKLRSFSADGNSMPSVEYGGTISGLGGRSSLFGDKLITYGLADRSSIAVSNTSAANANILGFVHNHPSYGFDQNLDLEARYPSDVDWASADYVVNNLGVPADISIFIIDWRGGVREFKYSDKIMFQALSPSQKRRGDMLGPVITSSDCVSRG